MASLLDGLRTSEFCYVLTSRQMGKSSLMVRAATKLREQGVQVVVLDLAAIRDFVLPLRDAPVVVFVDELDMVRSLPFKTDEFFAAIRECYSRRTEDSEFSRLTFCLLGVATPSELIRDPRITPFNIGRRIELTDFTPEEAAPLAQGLVDRSVEALTGQSVLSGGASSNASRFPLPVFWIASCTGPMVIRISRSACARRRRWRELEETACRRLGEPEGKIPWPAPTPPCRLWN